MAFNLENMSVDYKSLLRLVPTQRMQVAQSGALNDLISALTPGQMVSLFPRYYKEQLPDVGESSIRGAMTNAPGYRPTGGGGGTAQPYTPPPQLKMTMTPEQKAVQQLLQEAKVGQYADLPKGKIGLYRPAYTLTEADLSDQVIRTIAGEARLSSKEGVDAVINVMLNRVGSDQYGSNLLEVAAQGQGTRGVQFEGFNKGKVTAEQAEYIRQRIKALASGAEPDNTFGANEFRGDYYVFGEGRGKDFYRDAEKQGFVNIGGNIFAARGNYTGPYQGYDQSEVQKKLQQIEIESASQNIQTIETAMGKFEASMIEQLDARLQNYYKNADPVQQKYIEEALGKLGADRFNETMKNQPINTPTLQAVSSLPPGESRVSEEQAGFRSSPLKPELRNALEYAAEQSGLYVKVFSGGQTEEQQAALKASGSDPSNRHDIENPDTPGAADIRLAYLDSNGREVILDQSNPDHWPKIAEFVKNSSRTIESAGVGGWSPNDNYMGKTALHVGGPNKKGDAPLAYQGMEYLKQAHAEGVALREQDKKNNYDPLNEWVMKKKQERENLVAAEAEALRTSDPVSAARANQENLKQNTPAQYASGGTVIPGEDIAGVNLNTGDVEFMANSRERIRIDPAELENTQQMPTVTREDTERLEVPNQAAMQAQKPRPTYVENPDPNLYVTMAEGQMSMPPSQVRATNRAKMYGETSSGMINGHFA